MRLFNTRKKQAATARKILQGIVERLADEYILQRQFVNCKEYLAHNEQGLALDSLIELTIETGNHFSKEFWQEIKSAAIKMDMTDAIAYSDEQLNANE